MTQDNNGTSESISWFPYVLVVTAILVIGVVVLSMNGKKTTPGSSTVSTPVATGEKYAKTSDVVFRMTTKKDSKEAAVKLPHTSAAEKNDRFYYKFNLNYKSGEPTVFNIVADDCVEKIVVNDKPVEITGTENLKNRCMWYRGVDVDLKPYLKDGANKLYVEGLNTGGGSGLKVLVK